MGEIRIGTAGWAIPRQAAERFPVEGTTLERYAARFNAAEINSTFHRPHRLSTFERWAASVPDHFRFAVKLPKTITHKHKLVGCEVLLESFAAEIAPLGEKRGPLLVQLPPSLVFDHALAERFFDTAKHALSGAIVCEPRHASWFTAEADEFLLEREVVRVAADPSLCAPAAEPGGWTGLTYLRLHGSPRTYWSGYDAEALKLWAERVAQAIQNSSECWVIFDNTAGGAAAGNALDLAARLTA